MYIYIYIYVSIGSTRILGMCWLVCWFELYFIFMCVVIHIHRHTGLIRIELQAATAEAAAAAAIGIGCFSCFFFFLLVYYFCPHTTYVNCLASYRIHIHTHGQSKHTNTKCAAAAAAAVATTTTVCACTNSLIRNTSASYIRYANTLATNGIHAADHIAFCTIKYTIGSNKTKQSVRTRWKCAAFIFNIIAAFTIVKQK